MIGSDVPESSVWSAIGWDGGNYLMSSELHFERMIRHAEKLGLECPPDLSDIVFSTEVLQKNVMSALTIHSFSL